jgi:hypothetical protein
MPKYREWESDEYRHFKKPKRVESKDKLGKHRKSIYDILDNEIQDDYYAEDYDEFEHEDDELF